MQKKQLLSTQNIFTFLTIATLITLFIGGRAFNSNVIFIFLLFKLYVFFKNKYRFQFSNISFLFLGLYFLAMLSLFWTSDFNSTSLALIRFLPYLVFPIIGFHNFNRQRIIDFFSKTVVFVAVYCIVIALFKAIVDKDFNHLFYHQLSSSLGDVNAIYLSVLTSFSLGYFILKKYKSKLDIACIIIVFSFLLQLSSKLIITFTIVTLLIIFIRKRKLRLSKKRAVFITIAFLFLSLIATFSLKKRIKFEFEKTKFSEVLQSNEFGHVYLWTGTGLRLFQSRVFFEILQENKLMIIGFGLDNAKKSLDNKYESYNLYPGFKGYNYHNQYLQTFAELGFIGLLIILIIFFLLIKRALKRKDDLLLYFSILVFIVCITETFLWRQRGMVFFITISLLLYHNKKQIS